MARILIVGDDRVVVQAIRGLLFKSGHQPLVAWSGLDGLTTARRTSPDLIILDVGLPDMSGFDVCAILREESAVPTMMLTASDDISSTVRGLNLGADDYLTKPFRSAELIARVNALLRRAEVARRGEAVAREAPPPLKLGDLEVDAATRAASRHGAPIPLKPKEFELLLFLMRHEGELFSAHDLYRWIWGIDSAGDVRTVAVHIRHLREKIEDDPSTPRLIRTVRGAGYLLDGSTAATADVATEVTAID